MSNSIVQNGQNEMMVPSEVTPKEATDLLKQKVPTTTMMHQMLQIH